MHPFTWVFFFFFIKASRHAGERINWPGAVCHCLKECKTRSAKTEHCCLIREEFVSEEAKGLANTLAIQLCFVNKTTGMQGCVSPLCDHDRDADSMSVWSRLPRAGMVVGGWGCRVPENILPPLPPPLFQKQHTIIKTHHIHMGISGIWFPAWSFFPLLPFHAELSPPTDIHNSKLGTTTWRQQSGRF